VLAAERDRVLVVVRVSPSSSLPCAARLVLVLAAERVRVLGAGALDLTVRSR
jgi:hypothetical protein